MPQGCGSSAYATAQSQAGETLPALGESRFGVQGWTSFREDNEKRVHVPNRLPGETSGRQGHKTLSERIFHVRVGEE